MDSAVFCIIHVPNVSVVQKGQSENRAVPGLAQPLASGVGKGSAYTRDGRTQRMQSSAEEQTFDSSRGDVTTYTKTSYHIPRDASLQGRS